MAMISLSKILAYWCDRQPDRIAVCHEGQTISWAALEARTNRLARAYEALGVRRDNFVTIALPNGIEFIEACFAIWKLGATPQPVSAKLPKYERDQITGLAKPSLVVGVATGEVESAVSIAAGYDPDPTLPDSPLEECTAKVFKAMTSGGSTGRPKLIVTDEPAKWDPEADFFVLNQGSVLVPGPLYHNGPFVWVMGGLFKGNQVTITTRFDAEKTLQLIEEQKVDSIYLVPTMMQRIWNLPEQVRSRYDLSSLVMLWHTAAPCPAWLKQAFIEWLGPDRIWEVYSSTEAQGGTIISGAEWLEHKGSVGRSIPSCEMKIVGEDGKTALPAGEIGEIYVRPMSDEISRYRYIGAESKLIDEGWESFGDMGFMDADGYLYLSDRRTDLIISGGANIFPAEVEAAIDACPGVRSSAVIGLPHADMGQAVHAIVDAPDHDISEEALILHLQKRLAKYKVPRSFEFVDVALRDDAGKVRRQKLRDERMDADLTPTHS